MRNLLGDPTRFAPFLPRRLRLRCPRRWLAFGALVLGVAAAAGCGHALAGRSEQTFVNLPIATAGGQQLWADLAWDDGWRVQQHVWTGHARLLDDRDVRRAWGGPDACLAKLERRRADGEAQPPRRDTVVLLHGLWRTRDSMAPLAAAFEDAGFDVIDVAYPSTRGTIDEHAAQVARVLDRLPGAGRDVSFVTHSLGALVTRALLAREQDPWQARHRPHRAVFIAAPNGGSKMAREASRVPGAFKIYGEPARELARATPGDLPPAPSIPFATIAAVRGDGEGWNPLVPGDDDGVVGVNETRLAGETASLTVEGVHTFVMRDPAVARASVAFVTGAAARRPGSETLEPPL
ncbi:MAG: alpha/beta fold hydrolase [Planctomycetota bacterium]